MLTKIYKSEWLPIFGQSYVLVELDNGNSDNRFGKIVTVTFHGDRKTVKVEPLSVDAQLPKEFFTDEAVLVEMATIGQNGVKNQVYEMGKELKLDWLAYLPDLSFSETNIESLLFAITRYRAFEIFDKIDFRSAGEFAKKLTGLKWKAERWWFKAE
jgi:hypothetical protein